MTQVFISYSRSDTAFVRRLHSALAHINRDTWIDWQGIPPSAEWRKEIEAGIEAAENFIFVVSQDSVVSIACLEEVAYADKNNKRLVPIVLQPVLAKDIPTSLSKFNFIFFRESDNFQSSFASLVEALDTDLEWKRVHTRLLIRAKEWNQQNRDGSFLLTGKDLLDAEESLARSSEKIPRPTALQRDYILASRRNATTRLRMTLAAVSFAFVVAVALAVLAWQQRNIAKAETARAESRAAAAQAEQALTRDPAGALNFALQSWQAAHTPEARFAITDSSVQLLTTLRGHASAVTFAVFSHDGRRIATSSVDTTACVWDSATGQQLAILRGHTLPVTSVVFSPDDERILTAGQDRTARVWNPAGKLLVSLRGHNDRLLSAVFSPDGQRVLTASQDRAARVWDAISGRLLLT